MIVEEPYSPSQYILSFLSLWEGTAVARVAAIRHRNDAGGQVFWDAVPGTSRASARIGASATGKAELTLLDRVSARDSCVQ